MCHIELPATPRVRIACVEAQRRHRELGGICQRKACQKEKKLTIWRLIASGRHPRNHDARNLRFGRTMVVERMIVGERRRSLNYSWTSTLGNPLSDTPARSFARNRAAKRHRCTGISPCLHQAYATFPSASSASVPPVHTIAMHPLRPTPPVYFSSSTSCYQ